MCKKDREQRRLHWLTIRCRSIKDKYLNDSDVYGLQVDENIVSLAVILHIDKNTLEPKKLFTKKEYRGKGYAKKLLKSLCGNYKQKYNKMLVGTTENNIPLYVRQGFDKYGKTIKKFLCR